MDSEHLDVDPAFLKAGRPGVGEGTPTLYFAKISHFAKEIDNNSTHEHAPINYQGFHSALANSHKIYFQLQKIP